MAYHDVLFPEHISYGSQGGPGFFTQIVLFESGMEQRYPRWEQERREYDVRYGIKSREDVYEIYNHFLARMGATHTFPFWDPFDFTSHPDDGTTDPTKDDQTIGTGDGTETQFQLIKKYSDPGRVHTRNITKPKDGTVLIAFDGVQQSAGWSCNASTGIVIFDTAPSIGIEITAGYKFNVHGRYGEEADRGLQWALSHYDGAALESIPIVEVKSEIVVSDEFLYGGAKHWGVITADTEITHAEGRVHVFTPALGHKIILPNPNDHQLGGPHFYLVNDGTAGLSIYDNDTPTNFIKGLAAGTIVAIILAKDNLGNKEWRGK